MSRSDAATLTVTVRWGDYGQTEIEGADGKPMSVWQRRPREEDVALTIAGAPGPLVRDVPDSGGLQLHVVERLISAEDLAEHIQMGTRSVSVFLVNHRLSIAPDEGEPDVAYAFQPEIEVRSDRPFVPRPDLRGALASEWDEQVADLHYADTPEYATGHGVSAEWEIVDGTCSVLRSAWIPSAEVEKTETVERRASSFRWRSSGSSPTAPLSRRRCDRSSPSTATGLMPSSRLRQGPFGHAPRDCGGTPSLGGYRRRSDRSWHHGPGRRMRKRSTRSAWPTGQWREPSESASGSSTPRNGMPSSSRSFC